MTAKNLAAYLGTLSKALSDHPHVGPLHQNFGWQGSPLDKDDLSYMAHLLQEKVESIDWTKSTQVDIDSHLAAFGVQINWLITSSVPQLVSGYMVPYQIVATLTCIDTQLSGLAGEAAIRGTLGVPAKLHRLTLTAQKRIDALHVELPQLADKVQAITKAHEASEKLDVTLSDLDDALLQITRSKENAASFAAAAQAHRDELASQIEELKAHQVWAGGIRKQVGETYVASTNAGLAAAFSAKARALALSVWGWLVALAIALAYAGFVGHLRFPTILAAVGTKPDWGVVLVNLMLSALSLAPAVWLGWVATKQIGQRFRLSEDYAYKAALSMAYEGYRAEASKIDPALQSRLFSSALSRLDELPLRLVEKDVHATPAAEFFKSETMGKSIEELKAMRDWISGLIDKVKPGKSSEAKDPD